MPAESAPARPVVFVLNMVRATVSADSFVAILPTDPPLNPNQPIHNNNASRVTRGIFDAGILLFGYLHICLFLSQ